MSVSQNKRAPELVTRANSLRPAVWRAVRLTHRAEGSFSAPWVASLAGVKVSAALQFLAALASAGVVAGYVAEATVDEKRGRAVPGGPRYRLVRDLGPKTPVVRRVYEIYDPNSNTTLPRVRAKESV